MSTPYFSNQPGSTVQSKTLINITSAAPGKIHKVPQGSAVKIYPTSAGTAAVYSTNTQQQISDLDTDNAAILASTNASWDVWEAGTVSEKTVQATVVPVETVALLVSSGTWVLEISA
jgi:hypothetical protein